MASLLSSWSSSLQSLPANYVVPVEARPGNAASISKDIPVIDLGEVDRAALVQKIIKASQEFGLFQVINHGIPEKLMMDAEKVGKQFFSMAVEEKTKLSADDDAQNGWKLFTSYGNHGVRDFAYWKDTLAHPCHPLEDCMKTWPDKPARYREIIGPYTFEVRNLGIRVVDMIYEGLGLTEEKLDNYNLYMMIHNYPPCPDPSSALGLPGHIDGSIITIIKQDAYGLQLFQDGSWLGVEPLPNAFVINVSFMLEVISNGKLKSALHRVVANSETSRTAFANFMQFASPETKIEPSKSLVSPSNPPVFRGFHLKEYVEVFVSNNENTKATAEYFRIRSQSS